MPNLRLSGGLPCVALVLFLALSASTISAQVTVTTSSERIDWDALDLQQQQRASGDIEAEATTLFTKDGVPSDGEFFFPWILDDTQGSLGPATLYSVRNEGLDFSPVDVQVQFFNERLEIVSTNTVTNIQPNQVFPRTLRDQRELIVNNQVARGIAFLSPSGPVSVDVFEVDYANDFASGGLAFTADDFCVDWTARFLRFAPAVEGTEMAFIINGPLGDADNASIVGEVFSQRGDFVRSFSIQTGQSLVVINSRQLTGTAEFGSMEVRFVTDPADGGGIVTVLHRAFDRFSIGHRAICVDNVPPPPT